MCGSGNLQACDVMYAYDEMARSGVAGGSPADSTWECRQAGSSRMPAPLQQPRNNPRLDDRSLPGLL